MWPAVCVLEPWGCGCPQVELPAGGGAHQESLGSLERGVLLLLSLLWLLRGLCVKGKPSPAHPLSLLLFKMGPLRLRATTHHAPEAKPRATRSWTGLQTLS